MLLRHRLAGTMAVALCTASTWVAAGIVQVGVRAFASDTPSGQQFIANTDFGESSTTASHAVSAVAGNAAASVMVQADALNGTLKEKLSASVVGSRFIIGRNSGGRANASMVGSINLAGPLPGLATFGGILEGTYNILAPAPFDNSSVGNNVRFEYNFYVGNRFFNSPDLPPFQGNQSFFCCGAGTFSIPFSWTQPVNPGDKIDFSFYLRTEVSALVGLVDFDATNTFKITNIDLPTGYSFTSDATGFLSQFGATPVAQVDEPQTLLLVGLGGILAALTRRRIVAKSAFSTITQKELT